MVYQKGSGTTMMLNKALGWLVGSTPSRSKLKACSFEYIDATYSLEWGLPDEEFVWVRLGEGKDGSLIGRVCLGNEKGKIVLIDDRSLIGVYGTSPLPLAGDFALVRQIEDSGNKLTGCYCSAMLGRNSKSVFVATEERVNGKRVYAVFSVPTIDAAMSRFKELSQSLLETWAEADLRERGERETAEALHQFKVELSRNLLPSEEARKLFDIMHTHDWWYSYSDDGTVWKRGKGAEDAILAGLRTLPSSVRVLLWSLTAPSNYTPPEWLTRD
jgi:hypothetical protein